MTMGKTGFRIRLPKDGSNLEVELIQTGLLCSTAKDQNITLIYHGEVIGETRPLKAAEVLQEYLANAASSFDKFDGAFVLLFLDETAKTAVETVEKPRLHGNSPFLGNHNTAGPP